MYIISKCLLGENCKYNGGNNFTKWVLDFAKRNSYLSVCPEMIGNLPCPRLPSEIVGDRVINKQGEDVTDNFEDGATIALNIAKLEAKARNEEIEGAILKANSPSCGFKKVYDGTFTGKLVDGNGIFVRKLINEDIMVITEKEKIDG
ncbi:MAG: DUF523 domain-containing protein [Anaerovoracaceae bacterium]